MRVSERGANDSVALPRIDTLTGNLDSPAAMRLVTRIDEQLLCLDEYFIATGRPPERQAFFRRIAREIFPRSVTVAYVVSDRVVGGFSLVRPPSPVLELLPEGIRESHAFFREHAEEEFLSISMVWLKKEFRGFVHSARLWHCLFIVVGQCSYRFILYNYSLAEEKNWNLYKKVTRPINLFDGTLSNGFRGGVEYIPVEHLIEPTRFLDGFLNRHGRRSGQGRGQSRRAETPNP